jgi:Zn-dependent protease
MWCFSLHFVIQKYEDMEFIFPLAILLMSVVIHEVSHGYAALMLGDRTAQYAGRLTLNPIKHLDMFGSILLPLLLVLLKSPFLFGYAKPVPYNPYNLSIPRWGPAIVAVAGPIANVTVALVFGMMVRVLPLIQVVSAEQLFALITVAKLIVFINLLLAIFNLIPIPPLDGSGVLFALLPWRYAYVQELLTRYGSIVLIIFIFFFFQLLSGPIFFVCDLFTGSICF